MAGSNYIVLFVGVHGIWDITPAAATLTAGNAGPFVMRLPPCPRYSGLDGVPLVTLSEVLSALGVTRGEPLPFQLKPLDFVAHYMTPTGGILSLDISMQKRLNAYGASVGSAGNTQRCDGGCGCR